MTSAAERVHKIIVDQLVLGDRQLKDTDAISDLINEAKNGDSLDFVEIVMNVEEEFGVEINDDAAEAIKTVGDLVKHAEPAEVG